MSYCRCRHLLQAFLRFRANGRKNRNPVFPKRSKPQMCIRDRHCGGRGKGNKDKRPEPRRMAFARPFAADYRRKHDRNYYSENYGSRPEPRRPVAEQGCYRVCYCRIYHKNLLRFLCLFCIFSSIAYCSSAASSNAASSGDGVSSRGVSSLILLI